MKYYLKKKNLFIPVEEPKDQHFGYWWLALHGVIHYIGCKNDNAL